MNVNVKFHRFDEILQFIQGENHLATKNNALTFIAYLKTKGSNDSICGILKLDENSSTIFFFSTIKASNLINVIYFAISSRKAIAVRTRGVNLI